MADTIAGIVQVTAAQTVVVVGAALTAAVIWNLVTWRWGLPSSSSHALVGGLVGAAVVEAGIGAVNWGGVDLERHPNARQIPGLLLYRFDAPLFFANAGHFRRRISDLVATTTPRIRRVVVAAEPITDGHHRRRRRPGVAQ